MEFIPLYISYMVFMRRTQTWIRRDTHICYKEQFTFYQEILFWKNK